MKYPERVHPKRQKTGSSCQGLGELNGYRVIFGGGGDFLKSQELDRGS